MLDTLIYKNDVRDYLKKMVGIDNDDDLHLLGISEMVNVNRNVPKDKSGNIIAVYYAEGEIDGTSLVNTGSSSGINSEKVISDLRKLKEDKVFTAYLEIWADKLRTEKISGKEN